MLHASTAGVWKVDDEAEYFSSSQKRWLRAVVVKMRSNGDIKLKVFGSFSSNESCDKTVYARDVATKLRKRQAFDPPPRQLVRLCASRTDGA